MMSHTGAARAAVENLTKYLLSVNSRYNLYLTFQKSINENVSLL
jgi:hypothetical protein